MASSNALVVSQGLEAQQALGNLLARYGLSPLFVATTSEAETFLSREPVSLVLCPDYGHRGGTEEFIRRVSRPPANATVIVLARLGDWNRFLHCLHAGAFDYMLYPCSDREIECAVQKAAQHAQLKSTEQSAVVPWHWRSAVRRKSA